MLTLLPAGSWGRAALWQRQTPRQQPQWDGEEPALLQNPVWSALDFFQFFRRRQTAVTATKILLVPAYCHPYSRSRGDMGMGKGRGDTGCIPAAVIYGEGWIVAVTWL